MVVVCENVKSQRSNKRHKFTELTEGLPWYVGVWMSRGNVAPLQAMYDAVSDVRYRKIVSREWASWRWESCFAQALGSILMHMPVQDNIKYPSILPNDCPDGLKTYHAEQEVCSITFAPTEEGK